MSDYGPGQPPQWNPQQPQQWNPQPQWNAPPSSYPPPQQWGAPYGAPPPRRSNRGVLLGFGAVLVAGLVVLTLFLTGVFGGGSSSTVTSSPKALVQSYLTDIKNGDLAAARNLLCASSRAKVSASSAEDDERVTAFEVLSVDTSDDSHATVTAKITAGGRTQTVPFPTVKEDGAWRVCFTSLAPPTSSAGRSLQPGGGSDSVLPSASASTDDLSLVSLEVTRLYGGLSSASAQATATKNPLVEGTYIAQHNYPGLRYTAQECAPSGSSIGDTGFYLVQPGTVALDPRYVRITDGRYKGLAVTGTVYSFTLKVVYARSPSATNTVHATKIGDTFYFFFLCEA